MKVVKGIHKQGMFKHITDKASNPSIKPKSFNRPNQKGRYYLIKEFYVIILI